MEKSEQIEKIREEIVRSHETLSKLGAPFMTVVDINKIDENSSIFLGAENISIPPVVAALYRIIKSTGTNIEDAVTMVKQLLENLEEIEQTQKNISDEEE